MMAVDIWHDQAVPHLRSYSASMEYSEDELEPFRCTSYNNPLGLRAWEYTMTISIWHCTTEIIEPYTDSLQATWNASPISSCDLCLLSLILVLEWPATTTLSLGWFGLNWC